MKIRMLISIAGHADPQMGLLKDFAFTPNEIVDLRAPLANAWIAAGHAEKIKPSVVAAEPESAEDVAAQSAEVAPAPAVVAERTEATETEGV